MTINRVKDARHRINERIRAPKVRLIDFDNNQLGIVPIKEALQKAAAEGMDLVEVAAQADPPVCRIMDYNKFEFEQKKKRKKQTTIHLKVVKLRPGTGEGDYQVKLKRIQNFIEAGDKVKVLVQFRGREMAHKDLGRKVLERITVDLAELVKLEQEPKLEGRQMAMVLVPQKSKSK